MELKGTLLVKICFQIFTQAIISSSTNQVEEGRLSPSFSAPYFRHTHFVIASGNTESVIRAVNLFI